MAQKNGTKSRGGHGEKRSRRLDIFLALLLVTRTAEQAAEQAGISKRTAARWMSEPDVIARLRQAGQETWSRASAQIQAASVEAVECLRETMRTAESESARVTAAKALLELGQRAIELNNLEQRLERLEQIARSPEKGNHDQPISTTTGTVGKTNGSA
jgi:hypothetical protein